MFGKNRIYIYSYPQIDGKVNPYKIDGDLLFHLFGDLGMTLYIYIHTMGGGFLPNRRGKKTLCRCWHPQSQDGGNPQGGAPVRNR